MNELAKAALASLEVGKDYAKITLGDIGPQAFADLKQLMQRLGGRFNRKRNAFVFDRDFHSNLRSAQKTGKFDRLDANDFYPTPRKMAEELAECSELIREDHSYLAWRAMEHGVALRIVDACAGHGALVNAYLDLLKKRHPDLPVEVICVELDPVNCEKLRENGLTVFEGDFLEWAESNPHCADVVLSNPPFNLKGQKDCYIDHIEAAIKVLRREGEVLAIAPRSLFNGGRTSKKANFINSIIAQCRAWFDQSGQFDNIKAFKDAGASVQTVGVCLKSPTAFNASERDSLVDLFSVETSSGEFMYSMNEWVDQYKHRQATVEEFSEEAFSILREAPFRRIFVDYQNPIPYIQRLLMNLNCEHLESHFEHGCEFEKRVRALGEVTPYAWQTFDDLEAQLPQPWQAYLDLHGAVDGHSSVDCLGSEDPEPDASNHDAIESGDDSPQMIFSF